MIVHCAGIGGKLDCLSDVDEELCLQCIEANWDMLVGVKLRVTSDIANDGKHEVEAYRYFNFSTEILQPLLLMEHHVTSFM